MKNVALYCRVSSDDQKERDTIENQVEILHTYIEMKDNLKLYKEYLDNGVSGTVPLEQRDQGKDLIIDASKGLFDTVLVWKIDRFGRDTLSGLNAVEMLRKYDIEIMSVTEPFDLNTPTGRFQFITYLNMAELERNNILDRMYLGATRAAKKGKWLGGIVPYGYIINQDGYLEINENEASTIKKIFDLYTIDKMSTINIALYLNNSGIQSSCGEGKGKRTKNISGKWRSSSIQRILNSTTYKGLHEYGKRGSRRKETILRNVPAIVTEEQWNKVQVQKQENVLISKRCLKNREFLLRKLIKCKYCGKTFYGITYQNKNDVYVCSGKRGENKRILGIKCDNVNINVDMIENEIWDQCLNILKKYNEYINTLKSKSVSSDNVNDDLTKIKKSLSELKNEKNSILAYFRKNKITEEECDQQLSEIRIEEEKIKNLITLLESKAEKYKHEDELIKNMSDKLNIYYNKIDNLTNQDKYEVIKLLVKSIESETIIEDGKKVPSIHVVYNLVKLDDHKDMDSDSKFDIVNDKKFLPIISNKSLGTKLRDLRLKNNMTIRELSEKINISSTTLMHVEKDKIKTPYYYCKLICDYFSINHMTYLELYTMNQNSMQEKLIKIRAYIGARTWNDVANLLGYSEGFINDLMTRYTGNLEHIEKIDSILEKL